MIRIHSHTLFTSAWALISSSGITSLEAGGSADTIARRSVGEVSAGCDLVVVVTEMVGLLVSSKRDSLFTYEVHARLACTMILRRTTGAGEKDSSKKSHALRP